MIHAETKRFMDRLRAAPAGGGFRHPDYWVWCGSVMPGEDGRYHLFASIWPKKMPFLRGYIVSSEIVRAVSDTPEGPYTFQERVLPPRGEAFWDGRMTHNPSIQRINGTYVLFYIGTTFTGPCPEPDLLHRMEMPALSPEIPQLSEAYHNIRIGMATAPSVLGPWTRCDEPVLLPRKGFWDCSLVTNPAPCILPDGRIRLYYRSNTPDGLRLGVAEAEAPGAPFRRLQNDPLSFCDPRHYVEDPFVWRSGDRFEMIAKDITGGFTGERHAGVHATSKDGLVWEVSLPPKAFSRTILWDSGEKTVQGSLERPHLLIKNGTPTHLFAATANGPGGFHAATETWNMVIPLQRSS